MPLGAQGTWYTQHTAGRERRHAMGLQQTPEPLARQGVLEAACHWDSKGT